jgi:hypothetical protein
VTFAEASGTKHCDVRRITQEIDHDRDSDGALTWGIGHCGMPPHTDLAAPRHPRTIRHADRAFLQGCAI